MDLPAAAPAPPRRRRHKHRKRPRPFIRTRGLKWWHVAVALAVGLVGVLVVISILGYRATPLDLDY